MGTKKLLLLLIVLPAFVYSYAQDGLVYFSPKAVDATLQSKQFYEDGQGFFIDDVRFQNDTNFFTLYIINNGTLPLPILTAKGKTVTNLGLYKIPVERENYELILSLDYLYANVDEYKVKELLPGNYIRQELKIPCPGCTINDKRSVKFKLETPDREGISNTNEFSYWSNSFELYYNEQIFANYNSNIKENHAFNLKVGEASTQITVNDLARLDASILKSEIVANKDFEITSFNLIVVPQRGDVIIQYLKSGVLDDNAISVIKKSSVGDMLILDNIRAKSESGFFALPPSVYRIVEEENPLNLQAGLKGGEYIYLSQLKNLENKLITAPEFEGYDVSSFVLLTVPQRGEVRAFSIIGNELTQPAMDTIKALASGGRVLIDQVKGTHRDSGYKRNLPATVYTVVDYGFRVNFTVGTSYNDGEPYKIRKRELEEFISREVKLANRYSDEGYRLARFTLSVMPENGENFSVKHPQYTIEGDMLSQEILNELAETSVNSIITFEDIKLVNEETGEEKVIGRTHYKVTE